MIVRGIFTKGRHAGKAVSCPDVTANYLRMVLWQDLGERIEEIVRAELTRRGEVHFDATYNEAYRRKKRAQSARKAWQENYGGGSYSPPRPAAPAVPADRKLIAEIVAAGRQALAKRHHPDVGGDPQKMRDINAAADALLEWVGK